MMGNKATRCLCAILVVVMIASMCVGCQQKENGNEEIVIEPMEILEVPKVSFDIIGGDDVMPIGGYYTPLASIHSIDGSAMPDYLCDEYFQMVADSGVNLMPYPQVNYATNAQIVMESLDMAEKYNIAMGVMDANVTGITGNANSDVTVEEALESMSDYMNHPAFAGLFLYDEPRTPYYLPSDGTHDLSVYVNIAEVLNKEIGIWTYQNLNPCLNSKWQEEYDRYLQEYCETQSPTYILFDKYPMDASNRGKEEEYLFNLAIVREYAEKYNIPMWTFVQAGSQWNDPKDHFESDGYYPNEGEFDWIVNVNLAFGSKGIVYFPLFQPYWFAYAIGDSYDFERNGLIGAWGNKTRWYYYAQAINTHIAVIDEVLMNAQSVGILATGERSIADSYDTREALLEGSSWRELKDVSGDALIGCFNYQGKTALYVVNYSHEYAQKIDLSFVKECNVKVYQDAQVSYVTGNGITLDMPAGDGVLLVFE